jgi:uncharacterized membrane protein
MKKAFLVSMILGVLQAIGGIVAWQFMPEALPIRWDAAGNLNIRKGGTILIPAVLENIRIEPIEPTELLEVYI